MKLDQGDLVLVPFPFSDLKSKKQRPALVLSHHGFNRGPDVVVCAVTSNLRNTDHSILLDPTDMASGRLVTTSRIKAGKVATVHKSIIRRRVGTVKPAITQQVLKELRTILHIA